MTIRSATATGKHSAVPEIKVHAGMVILRSLRTNKEMTMVVNGISERTKPRKRNVIPGVGFREVIAMEVNRGRKTKEK